MKRYFFLLLPLIFASCAHRATGEGPDRITTLQIIDRNGFNETITNPDRIKAYQKNDFLAPQPYQKVVRVYQRSEEGSVPSMITSYHENGSLWQVLEVVSGRAAGTYYEYFPSGVLHIEANVIEGIGDITESAQETWVFDGENNVYDENGACIASILYDKGEQSGEARYFYPSGVIKRRIPYVHDRAHGTLLTYNEEGELIGENHYTKGVLDGKTKFLGDSATPPYEELYQEGLLVAGTYTNMAGEVVSQVVDGNGEMAYFDKGVLKSLNTYKDGIEEGLVSLFAKDGQLSSTYHVKDERKHGEEIVYYTSKRKTLKAEPKAKLSIEWYEDAIHGMVKTWYENGVQESQREMQNNQKHGMAFGWYLDGTLMLVEEYEDDKLIKGSYMKRGESLPVSKVEEGNGVATLFDKDGTFLRRVKYESGRCEES